MYINGTVQDARLHILMPVPILTRILRMEAAQIIVPDISQILLDSQFFTRVSCDYANRAAAAIADGMDDMRSEDNGVTQQGEGKKE